MSTSQLQAPVTLPRVNFKNILCATDFSACSEKAMHLAGAMARRYAAELFLVHAITYPPVYGTPMDPVVWDYEGEIEYAKQRMHELRNSAEFAGLEVAALTYHGDLWTVMETVLPKYAIDLLVLGTHGRGGLGKLFLGSASERILRLSPVPVLTIGPDVRGDLIHEDLPHDANFKSVLFATDFSAGSERALSYALSVAESNNARLSLLHLVDEGSVSAVYIHERLVTESRRRLEEMLPAVTHLAEPPSILVDVGFAAEQIVRYAKGQQADLIVMGVHKTGPAGAAASAHLPWTIASGVACHAPCPVLTVRG